MENRFLIGFFLLVIAFTCAFLQYKKSMIRLKPKNQGRRNEMSIWGMRAKVGDIIYPHYNGTDLFWKKTRWDLVTAVDKDGYIINVSTIWEHSVVRMIKLLREHKEAIERPRKAK